jgi:hypothetical protein
MRAPPTALGDHQRGGRDPGVHEVARDRDEVGERVALVLQLAVLVPLPPHFAPAAHVRDREDDAAVEHRQARDREARFDRVLVRPVAVEVHGSGVAGAGLAEGPLPHERHRHARPVVGDRPLAPLPVPTE